MAPPNSRCWPHCQAGNPWTTQAKLLYWFSEVRHCRRTEVKWAMSENCNRQNPRRLLRPGVEDMICGPGKLVCSFYWKGVELEQELGLELI